MKDLNPNKLYHSIGEVATAFDVSTSLIRFWEKEFDVLKPRKNKKGDRLFTQEDIKNLHIIFHLLKERGFTIEGAKKKLKENKNDTINQFEIVQSLNKLKSFLIEIKEDIN
jgi:DNA-binding transcriptional MerR regulator|tara:strand:+ start:247 stop:579 length:333 start_codon:yes stop_codon:yes gene_type:complete